MNAVLRLVLVVFIIVTLGSSALATDSDSMRCARGIVSIGDTAAEVLGKCGEPAYAAQRTDKRLGDRWKGYRGGAFVAVDDWTYNFGPNEFMYRVIIENGRVARIESLEHGY